MKLKIILIIFTILTLFTSCFTLTQSQKATRAAKQRYKNIIKTDCGCHSYLYEIEENSKGS